MTNPRLSVLFISHTSDNYSEESFGVALIYLQEDLNPGPRVCHVWLSAEKKKVKHELLVDILFLDFLWLKLLSFH